MRIRLRKAGKVNVLELAGKMTIGEGDVQLRTRMKELLAAGERFFVFDMLDVPVLDSASVGEVVACYRRAREVDGSIRLVLRGRVHDTFTMTHLDRVFEIFTKVDDALGSFAH
ncbi:MAG: STAS domain-containing protein [Acidobacteriota bacterium]|jgi:anti-sigma B factor antagonist